MNTDAHGNRSTKRALRAVLAVAAVSVAALGLIGAPAASAATTTTWATWADLTGSGGDYSTTMTLAGKPELSAAMTSDSGAGNAGVISGESTWLSEGTPIGEKYGSSRHQRYLNLQPAANNATSPSTTTYTFSSPTPTSGWAFALGDIDADMLRIYGTTADGLPLTAADLGFQGGFNYCAPGTVGKPSCTGDAADVPTWDPATMTLVGNPAAEDTSDAAAWFEPTVPISTLVFEFTWRSGFPVYQTWFASMARDITGVVSDIDDGPLDGVTVTLTDAHGTVIATTTTAGGGHYAFPEYFATDGYVVTATPPSGKTGVVTTGTADLRTEDAVVDLTVRESDPVPGSISGTVSDSDGAPVGGVTITVHGPTDTTVTSAPDGTYSVGDLSPGTYEISVTAPDGYTVEGPATLTATITASGDIIIDQDFTLVAVPPAPPTPPGGQTPGGNTPEGQTPGGSSGSLAATGADSTPFIVGGVIALAAGAALFAVSRLRRK